MKRVLYVLAAVVFVLAWLVAVDVGDIRDADTALLHFDSLIALGLALGFAGHAA